MFFKTPSGGFKFTDSRQHFKSREGWKAPKCELNTTNKLLRKILRPKHQSKEGTGMCVYHKWPY